MPRRTSLAEAAIDWGADREARSIRGVEKRSCGKVSDHARVMLHLRDCHAS